MRCPRHTKERTAGGDCCIGDLAGCGNRGLHGSIPGERNVIGTAKSIVARIDHGEVVACNNRTGGGVGGMHTIAGQTGVCRARVIVVTSRIRGATATHTCCRITELPA